MSQNLFFKFIIVMLVVITILSITDFTLSHKYEILIFLKEKYSNNNIENHKNYIEMTKNWQEYTNEKYGYKIKYPIQISPQNLENKIEKTKITEPLKEAIAIEFSPDFKIEFWKNENSLLAKEYAEDLIINLSEEDSINPNRNTKILKTEEKIINGGIKYIVEYLIESKKFSYQKKFREIFINRSISPDIIHIKYSSTDDWKNFSLMEKTFEFTNFVK